MEKTLSIVVPVYGAENYLNRNMKTIIDQLTPRCELILVDDGSEDQSGKICDQLAGLSENIIVIHKKNGGVSSARNVGIEAANGKYLVFVDSDDYVEPNYINEILNVVKTEKDIIFFGSYLIDGNSKKRIMKPWLSNIKDKNNIERAKELLFGCKSNELWDKVYDLNIIKNKKIVFPENVNLGEDLIFTLDYFQYVDTVLLFDKSLYCHTLNRNGLGQQKITIDILKYNNAMFSKIIESGKLLKISKKIETLAYSTILQILTNFVGKLYKFGYSNQEIYDAIHTYNWYKIVTCRNYKNIKAELRKILLKMRMYKIIMYIFNK